MWLSLVNATTVQARPREGPPSHSRALALFARLPLVVLGSRPLRREVDFRLRAPALGTAVLSSAGPAVIPSLTVNLDDEHEHELPCEVWNTGAGHPWSTLSTP